MTSPPTSEDAVRSGRRAASSAAGRAIGTGALILMAANLSGSVLGFIRSSIMAAVFGQTSGTDAFVAASVIPQMFYDLTIGAAISAALIPVFTEVGERRGRTALAETAGSVLAIAWCVTAAIIGILMLAADPLMHLLLTSGFGVKRNLDAATVTQAVRLVRIILPSLFFLGSSAVFLSTLYSLRRFAVSAFAAGFYHLGIIMATLTLAGPLGVAALPVGAVAGSVVQAAVQVPVLLRELGPPRIRLTLSPDVRRIIRLYAPVAAGLIVSIIGQAIDLGFKASLGRAALTAMAYGTFLTQFPIGIAVAGLSFAILPALSSDAAAGRLSDFKMTLSLGIRLAVFLTVPATVGYLTLGTPIVALLFQHQHFTASDTHRTVLALAGYTIQIPFVGLDQLLIFAFYARKNTVTPMLIGVVGVGIYVLAAVVLSPRLGILGLALANTLQNSIHGLILLVLLLTGIGSLRGGRVVPALARTLLSATVMTVAVLLLGWAIARLPLAPGTASRVVSAGVPVTAGLAIYLVAALISGNEELAILVAMVQGKRRLKKPIGELDG